MDIVYTALTRRHTIADRGDRAEVDQVVEVLWAHAEPVDRLEHAGGRAESDRVDLLLFLLPDHDTSAERRAAALLRRAHHASPLLRDRYLPPPSPAGPGH
ncbi:hypothetical protein OHV05_04695 [Kitasatospora sp. NBC_00070]|uniref:hypothetical protein n=1 Tax=Kitasatospora sp. NBC_00070 TaxID=2975962 RepID=UPI0032436C4E